jgi:MFS family permease
MWPLPLPPFHASFSAKPQVVVAQVLAGVMYFVLALLIMTGHIQPWHLYATAFGMAIVQTFHQPARAAMVSDAVAPCHLTNTIGLTSIMFNVARSTGPALAGFLIATRGARAHGLREEGPRLPTAVPVKNGVG